MEAKPGSKKRKPATFEHGKTIGLAGMLNRE
jgi:hypothetical protein